MTLPTPYYAPEFSLEINGEPIPAALRASISSVNYQTGLEGADRVELTLVNENLRWLDQELLEMDSKLTLSLGYAPGPLKRVFVGEIVAHAATFPSGSSPMLTITAQDKMYRLQQGERTRWFAHSIKKLSNFPFPDPLIAGIVGAENLLLTVGDDLITGFLGAGLSIAIGWFSMKFADDPADVQKMVRKQMNESDYHFLARLARENGMEMLIDHSNSRGGHKLRFMAPYLDRDADVTLVYGRSLIDFTPRITNVGQIMAVSTRLWWSKIKTEFLITLSWDWDNNALDLDVSMGFGLPSEKDTGVNTSVKELQKAREKAKTEAEQKQIDTQIKDTNKRIGESSRNHTFQLAEDIQEPVTLSSAPRLLVGRLIPKLNQRQTGTGSTIGNPRIKAGTVLSFKGLGKQFGGLYRVTSATHTIDSSGYRTSFDVRKEIWLRQFEVRDIPEQALDAGIELGTNTFDNARDFVNEVGEII